MIVIIPEGLGALVPSGAGSHGHSHFRRNLESGLSPRMPLSPMVGEELATVNPAVKPRGAQDDVAMADDTTGDVVDDGSGHGHEHSHDEPAVDTPESHEEGTELPTFFIGFSMISGFVLMFLIDRLPKHIAESQWSAAAPREVRLDNLGVSSSSDSDEPDRLMGSQSEGPKQSRSASTTTGLVIQHGQHAPRVHRLYRHYDPQGARRLWPDVGAAAAGAVEAGGSGPPCHLQSRGAGGRPRDVVYD